MTQRLNGKEKKSQRDQMKPFRCYNTKCAKPGQQLTFWAEEPVCPKCGADARNEADMGMVLALTVIHFDPPHKKYGHMGLGQGVRACDGTCRGMRSGDPRAVNCPACLQTDALKAKAKEWECMDELPPESAFEAFRRIAPDKAREYEEAAAAAAAQGE